MTRWTVSYSATLCTIYGTAHGTICTVRALRLPRAHLARGPPHRSPRLCTPWRRWRLRDTQFCCVPKAVTHQRATLARPHPHSPQAPSFSEGAASPGVRCSHGQQRARVCADDAKANPGATKDSRYNSTDSRAPQR